MKFNEFINYMKSVGGVDADGAYRKQCMDFYNYYCNNVLGIPNVGVDCANNILNNKSFISRIYIIILIKIIIHAKDIEQEN